MFKLHMGVCLATPTHWATPTPTGPRPFPKKPKNLQDLLTFIDYYLKLAKMMIFGIF